MRAGTAVERGSSFARRGFHGLPKTSRPIIDDERRKRFSVKAANKNIETVAAHRALALAGSAVAGPTRRMINDEQRSVGRRLPWFSPRGITSRT